MRTLITVLVLAAAVAVGAILPAAAHKVVAGAYASGDHIEGEIGFSDGSMAKNVVVLVVAADGTRLGEVNTGEDGTFVFTPTRRVTHVFRADLGGGHVAEVRVEAADLPGSLGAADEAAVPMSAPAGSVAAVAAPATAVTEAQRAALTEAVRNEVKPLRREIIALKEKNDLQSVLGGIGYIVGLFGLWFFLAARRRSARAA